MGEIVINNFNSQKVQLDIANFTSREPYALLSLLKNKIIGHLQRKFKLKVDSKLLEEKIKNYKAIYGIVKKNLPQYVLPSKTGFTEPQYIKNKELKELLIKIFPEEDRKILDIIKNWVIEYEYLR